MKKALVALATAFVAQSAFAQPFPSKPLKMIIPFAPGGSTDIAGRLAAAEMSTLLGQPIAVENRAGAAGAIGIDAVAKSAADGYTVGLSGSGPTVILHIVGPKPPFAVKDLNFVGNVGLVELMFIAKPDTQYRDLRAMIALARANPGKYLYAHGGTGSPSHLGFEYLKSVTGISMDAVVYKGDGPLITDLMGGQVEFAITAVASAAAQVKAGKVRALGVASAVRSPSLPDVPTAQEQGAAGYEAATFNLLAVPAATPTAVAERLSSVLAEVTRKPDFRLKFAELGMVPVGGTPKQTADFVERETAKWAKVIRDAKITAP